MMNLIKGHTWLNCTLMSTKLVVENFNKITMFSQQNISFATHLRNLHE